MCLTKYGWSNLMFLSSYCKYVSQKFKLFVLFVLIFSLLSGFLTTCLWFSSFLYFFNKRCYFYFFYIGDSRKHWNSEWDNMASVSHYSIYCVCFLFLNPIPISPYLMSTTTTTNAQNVHVRAATCFRMAAHLIKWQPQTPGYIMSSADTTDTKSWILNFLLRYL